MPDRDTTLIEGYLASVRDDRAKLERFHKDLRPGQYAIRQLVDALNKSGVPWPRANTLGGKIEERANQIKVAEAVILDALDAITQTLKLALAVAAERTTQ